MSHPLRVLQVSQHLYGGGAERIALTLHAGMRSRGHESWMALADITDVDDQLVRFTGRRTSGIGSGAMRMVARALQAVPGEYATTSRITRRLALSPTPEALASWVLGAEDFDFPLTRTLPTLIPKPPDVVHLHNLHGGYFDLRALPILSSQAVLVATMHDEWLMTGHCSYTLGCERWRDSCGECPDLTIYPAIRRDRTADNLHRKAGIYAGLRIGISAPSRWLLERAQSSVLREADADWRVIPNGVDQAVFNPGDRTLARVNAGVPVDEFVVLFVANRPRTSQFKDFETITGAVARAATRKPDQPLRLLVVGEDGPDETADMTTIQFVGYDSDPHNLASLYRAADLYVHAAHAENYPTTTMEAMSCGLPVVSTATGGIPEQVQGLVGLSTRVHGQHGPSSATGVLTSPGDVAGMAEAIARLREDDRLRNAIAENATAYALENFGLDRQIDRTEGWYQELLAARGTP